MVAATPVRHPVAVGAGLLSLSLCFQQVLLLQSLEVGEPLSVLSLAPLPAIVDRTTSIIGKTGRSDWLNDKPGRKKEQCCDAPNQNNRLVVPFVGRS